MDRYYATVNALRILLLLVGSAIIFSGIARGAFDARGAGGKAQAARQITSHASLGLEFFVGAGILNLILKPTWPAVAAAALIVAVRKLITFSLSRSARTGV